MAYDLIIFDCDGTLVDSEHLNNVITAELLAGVGLTQYDADYAKRHFAGMSFPAIADKIFAETGIRLPPGFQDDFVDGVTRAMPTMMKLIEGVSETLEVLKGRVKICVGSNGERVNVVNSLRHAGLIRFFPDQAIFTKDMVPRPKPAPDLFLHAARTMGAQPERVLVIEDSPTGAMAGKAAGMTVIGFAATYHDRAAQEQRLRDAGAQEIASEFASIIGFLNRHKL